MQFIGRSVFQYFMVFMTFVLAFMLETMQLPSYFFYIKPLWPLLVLLFWNITYTEYFNIFFAFIIGIIWDVSVGSILGLHSLLLICIIYTTSTYIKIILNFSLIQQSIIILFCAFFLKLGTAIIYLLFKGNIFMFDLSIIISPIISALLWGWIFLLLKWITFSR